MNTGELKERNNNIFSPHFWGDDWIDTPLLEQRGFRYKSKFLPPFPAPELMYWNFFFLLGAVVWGERLKSAASALHCYIPNYQLLCSGCWAVVWQLLQQRSVRSRLSWARMASSSSNQAVIRAPLPTYLHNHTHTYKKRGHNSQTQVAVRFKSLWKYITEIIPKALLYMFQYNLPFRKIDESKVWKLLLFLCSHPSREFGDFFRFLCALDSSLSSASFRI